MQDRRPNLESKANIKPTGHRILVLLDDIDQLNKTESGLVIAMGDGKKREQEAHSGATVIRMGPTCYNLEHHGDEPWCREGDRVLIAPYSGKRIPGHDRLRMINDEDVTAVESDEDLSALQDLIEQADLAFEERIKKAREVANVG